MQYKIILNGAELIRLKMDFMYNDLELTPVMMHIKVVVFKFTKNNYILIDQKFILIVNRTELIFLYDVFRKSLYFDEEEKEKISYYVERLL